MLEMTPIQFFMVGVCVWIAALAVLYSREAARREKLQNDIRGVLDRLRAESTKFVDGYSDQGACLLRAITHLIESVLEGDGGKDY